MRMRDKLSAFHSITSVLFRFRFLYFPLHNVWTFCKGNTSFMPDLNKPQAIMILFRAHITFCIAGVVFDIVSLWV